jgi:hypothetical protein
MTQKDPLKRLSVDEYLSILLTNDRSMRENDVMNNSNSNNKSNSDREAVLHPDLSPSSVDNQTSLFPVYFESFLHPFMLQLHWQGITPDHRINIICEVYSSLFIASLWLAVILFMVYVLFLFLHIFDV